MQTIIAQAVAEANAQGKPAVIAVVDRVGNVLAVYSMTGAPPTATIRNAPNPSNNTDLEGLTIPAAGAAIAKAITGAYLSSGGNAFSTRTASEIVQQNFPPEPSSAGLESGPLFGVQFSQLPCSDLSSRYIAAGGAAAMIGPKRSPLGLAADPGGFPLYKNSVLVGGVGVMADGDYGFDPNIAGCRLRHRREYRLGGHQRLCRARQHHRRQGLHRRHPAGLHQRLQLHHQIQSRRRRPLSRPPPAWEA